MKSFNFEENIGFLCKLYKILSNISCYNGFESYWISLLSFGLKMMEEFYPISKEFSTCYDFIEIFCEILPAKMDYLSLHCEQLMKDIFKIPLRPTCLFLLKVLTYRSLDLRKVNGKF